MRCWIPLSIGLVAWLVACIPADTETPPTSSDTGSDTDSDTSDTDSDTSDTGSDTASTDTGPVEPTMLVHAVSEAGDDLPDVDVLVSDAAGDPVLHTRTGADGTVEVPVVEGGLVMVLSTVVTIDRDSQLFYQRQLVSHPSTPDGFTPWLRVAETAPPEREDMTVRVTLQDGCDLPSGAASFRMMLSCGGDVTGLLDVRLVHPWYDGCDGETGFDVTVYALDEDDYPVGHTRFVDQVFVAGTTRDYQACPDATDFDELILIADGVPEGSRVETSVTGDGRSPRRYFRHPGVAVAPADGRIITARRLPADAHEVFGWRIDAYDLQDDDAAFDSYLSWNDGGLDTLPDYVVHAVGDHATVTELSQPDYVQAARPRVSWALTDEGALGDVHYVSTVWWREAEYAEWVHVGPPAREGTVRLPVLPDALEEYRPGVDITVGYTALDSLWFGRGGLWRQVADHPIHEGAVSWHHRAHRSP